MSEAADITRRARSNLAFALSVLPAGRRDDAVLFYAYCRTLDDLADAPGTPVAERAAALAAWKHGLVSGFSSPTSLQLELVSLRDRLGLPTGWLTALIDGCVADLEPRRFVTWEELDRYIWQVACSVGLVSARVFGCRDPGVDAYAEALGRALQITNILRDVAEDWDRGRVYVPDEEWQAAGMSSDDLAWRPHGGRFADAMERVARRADHAFAEADRLAPVADFKALLPARIMEDVYRRLLHRMRMDGFRVFQRRYRLSLPVKVGILAKHRIAMWWGRR